MDRREAIKAAAALMFASGASAAVFTPPPLSSKRLEKLSLEWNKQRSSFFLSANEVRAGTITKRTKWRIVDQMIEEHGDGET